MSNAVAAVKMNGAHNTFIVVDARSQSIADPVAFARRACDPHRGPGADGVLLVLPSASDDARMRVINADGSEAEMCGNGLRCVVRFLDECDGRAPRSVETLAGSIATRIVAREPYTVAVTMAEPRIGVHSTIAGYPAVEVNVGNPHVVIAVDSLERIDIATLGPAVEHDPRYPQGTNVHAVVFGAHGLDVVHWERGAGATAACGTGAVAAAAVALYEHGASSPVTVRVPGGMLQVALSPGSPATLIGDAVVEQKLTLSLA